MSIRHIMSALSLPHLSMFYGGPHLLQIVSGGTNLTHIYIAGTERFYISGPLTNIIQSPPIRELYIENAEAETPQALLAFIRSIHAFKNLELLWIDHYLSSETWEESHVTAKDSYDTILFLLSRLPHVQVIKIHSEDNEPEDEDDFGYPSGATEGNPNVRSWHPTLEAIYVDFLRGMWLWSPREGWIKSHDWQGLGRSSPWVDFILEI